MGKGNKKRLLAWLMAIVLITGNMPLSVFASSADEQEVQTAEMQPEGEKKKPEEVTESEGEKQKTEEVSELPVEEQKESEVTDELKQEEPKQPEKEKMQVYAETKVSVLYSDMNNIAKRRELDGNKLLDVYADGAKMEEQPKITLDSEQPEEVSGAQSYTYTIHNLPIYREGGAEKIEYTVREEDVLKGYTGFEEFAAPDGEVKLIQGDAENTLKAEKKFGNYLSSYEVSGTVNWKPTDTKAVRPDMESYFQKQFRIVRDGDTENYTAAKIHYKQSKESADCWNFTVEGLFTTKEDGSKASYTIKADAVEGYIIEQTEVSITENNKGLEFIYKAKEVKQTARKKAAVREEIPTTSVSLTVNWVDNNNINRPKPGELEKHAHIWRKVGEDGFWEEIFEKVTCQTVGMQSVFKSGQLPAKTETGETIFYEIRIDYTQIPGYMHLTEDNEYLIKQTTFSGDIVLRYGEDSSKSEEEIATELKGVLELSATYNGDNNLTDKGYFAGVNESLKITGNDGEYKFEYTVPEFVANNDNNNHEIIWKLNAPESGKLFEADYIAEYDNKNASNHGQKTDACYQGGMLILTRTGTTEYKATKVWLDDGESGTVEKRPTATMTLWRYTKKAGSDFQTAAVVLDEAGKKVTVAVDNTRSPVTITDESLKELPKYDKDGYEYIYIMREKLSGSGYEQVFGAVEEGGNVKDTYPNADGVLESTYDVRKNSTGMKQYDNYLYNGGTLSNRIAGTQTVKQTKVWKAAAVQDAIKDVKVTLTLYSRASEDGTWEPVTDKDGHPVSEKLSGFIGEAMSKTVSASMPKYDYMGRPLYYRWFETDVTGAVVKNESGNFEAVDGTTEYSLELEGETYDFKSFYRKSDDGEEVVNQLIGKTQYTVKKIWKDANGNEIEDTTDTTRFPEITVKLYQDGKEIKSATLNGSWRDTVDNRWIYVFEDLDKYDEEGREYIYMGQEVDIAGWHTESIYNPKDLGIIYHPGNDSGQESVSDKPLNLKLINTPPGVGNEVVVEKEWLDDSNLNSRKEVLANLVAEQDIWLVDFNSDYTIKENGIQKVEADNAVKEGILLTAQNNWYQEVDVPYAFVVDGNESLDEAKERIIKLRQDDKLGNLENDKAFYIRENSVGGKKVETTDTRNQALINPKAAGYVDTGDFYYEVKYREEAGKSGRDSFIITNRRIGTVNLKVTKKWVDEGATKDDRPNVELQLHALGEQHKGIIGAEDDNDLKGKITIKDKAGNIVEQRSIKTGEISGDTVTLEDDLESSKQAIDKEHAESTYTFLNLPKYDANGAVIHYSVTEEGKKGEYNLSQEDGGYRVVERSSHTLDVQERTFTNTRTGIKKIAFRKIWQDMYNKVKGTRPDIYLNLYSNAEDEDNPKKVAGYQDREWKAPDTDSDYFWTCQFEGLPKYTSTGREITYYAEELMSIKDPKDFDYQDPAFGTNTYTKTVGKSELFAEVGIGSDGKHVENDEGTGTIINTIQSDMKFDGKKIWKGIEGVENEFATVDFPTIKIKLTRKIPTEIKSDGTCVYGKDDEGFNAKNITATLSPEQAKRVGNSFTFTLADFKDKDDKAVNDLVVKYYQAENDPTFVLPYEYTLEEDGIIKNGTKDEAAEKAYKLSDPCINTYIMTNVYKTTGDNAGTITVNKNWNFNITDYPKGKAPEITFALYRQYPTKMTEVEYPNDVEKLDDGTVCTKKVKVKTVALKPGETKAKFENLPILAPNAEPYIYWLVEMPTDGYDLVTTDINTGWKSTTEKEFLEAGDSTKKIYQYTQSLAPQVKQNTLQKIWSFVTGKNRDASTVTEASITNTYYGEKTNNEKITVTGDKKWVDYNNQFGTRPDDIELTLIRYADKQSGSVDNSIPEETVATFRKTGTDTVTWDPETQGYINQMGDISVSWNETDTNTWTYTLSNLDRYAPNGNPWKYKVVEKTKAVNYDTVTPSDGTVTGKADTTTGNVTMDDLTNSFYTSITGTKKWDKIANLQRPEVKVKLQVNDGTQWYWADSYDKFKDIALDVEEKTLQEGQWSCTYSELPKGFKNAAGQYTDYKYRVMETNVGDTAVIFDKANGTEYADDQGNLPFKITSENNDDGTETTITNELLPTIKTSLTVTKKWSDYDNLYLTRPLNQDKWEAKFHVYRTYTKDGQENSERVLDTKGNPVVLTVTGADKTGNEESVILEDLPAKDLSGTLYEYSAVELNTNKEQTEVSGDKRFHGTYNVEYAQTKEKKPVSGTDLTVTHYTTTVTNTMKETALQVTKQWAGDDKGFRPKELNLTLYRKAAEGLWEAVTDSTGKNPATPKWTKNADNTWTATYEHLPMYAPTGESNLYSYKVTEDTQSGYLDPQTEIKDTNLTLTNTATSFKVDKVDSTTSIRDKNVKITLSGTDTVSDYQAVWSRTAGTEKVEVTKEDISIYTEEKTDRSSVDIKGLPLGTYKVEETKAGTPDGYETPISLGTITLKSGVLAPPSASIPDGTLDIDAAGSAAVTVDDTNVTVKIANTKTGLIVEKQELDRNTVLSGAKFKITPATEGETFADGTTTSITFDGSTADEQAIGQLIVGHKYILEEVTQPDGYIKSNTKVTFELDAQGNIVDSLEYNPASDSAVASVDKTNKSKIIFKNKRIDIALEKTDNEGTKLPGATFEVVPKEGSSFADPSKTSITLDDTNMADDLNGNLKAGNSYILTETKAPTGYIRYADAIEFTVNVDGTLDLGNISPDVARFLNDKLTLQIKNPPITLQIQKKCGTEDVKAVTTFELYKGTEKLKEYQTDDKGKLTITDQIFETDNTFTTDVVEGSIYVLKETKAAAGYVTPAGDAAEITFRVKDDGTIQIEEQAEQLDVEYASNILNVQNEKTRVFIWKTDKAGTLISGGTFAIYRADDVDLKAPVAEWTNDGNAHPITAGTLAEDVEYQLVEVSRPNGYLKADPVVFTLNQLTKEADGSWIIKMQDEEISTSIALKKTYEFESGEGTEIPNVVFDLMKGDEVVQSQTTGDDGTLTFTNVKEGEYGIRENLDASLAAGVSDDVYIDVDKVIKVQVTADKDTEKQIVLKVDPSEDEQSPSTVISVTNAKFVTSLKLTKVDADDTTKKLSGVTFQLMKNGTEQGIYKTDDNGVLEIPGLTRGDYQLTETAAIDGYDLENHPFTATFTVTNDKQGTPIGLADMTIESGEDLVKGDVLTNARKTGSVSLKKVNEDRENPVGLRGAVFTLYRIEGEAKMETGKFTTGEDGNLVINDLKWGTYELKETTPPEGYKLNSDDDFTFTIDDTHLTKNFGNVVNKVNELDLEKTNLDGKIKLPGAKFRIRDTEENSSWNIEVTTGENGLAKISDIGLIHNHKYEVTEIQSSDGYIRNTGYALFHVKDDGTLVFDRQSTMTSIIDGGKTLRIMDIPIVLNILKTDETDKQAIKDVTTFELYEDGVLKNTYQTDETGKLLINDYLFKTDNTLTEDTVEGSVYTLKETKAAEGYVTPVGAAAEFKFTVSDDGKFHPVDSDESLKAEFTENNLEIQNERILGKATLSKLNVEGQGLNGTKFALEQFRNDKWTEIGTYTTQTIDGVDGKLIVDGLEWGTYRFIETVPTPGYQMFASAEQNIYTFEIGIKGNAVLEYKHDIINVENVFTIRKSDRNDDAKVLKGAEFKLTNVNNPEDPLLKDMDPIVTGDDGTVKISRRLTAGETYRLHETKAPVGYRLNPVSQDVVFTVDNAGKISVNNKPLEGNVIRISDVPTVLAFKKAGKINETCSPDKDATKPLEGVAFEIRNETSGETYTAASDKDGKVIFEGIPAGDYTITETKTAAGYILSEETYRAAVSDKPGVYNSLYDEEGNPLKNNIIVNDVYRADIVFTKVNEQNRDEVLPGSVYGLYKKAVQTSRKKSAKDVTEDGLQLIAKATTDENGVLRFEGVLMNTQYVIRELEAPDGSYVSEKPMKISFKMGENGALVIDEIDDGSGTVQVDEDGNIIWKEPSVQISFSKVDETGKNLPGAKLQVQDKEGTVVEEWISAETPYLSSRTLVLGETYKLVEVSAPDGYSVAKPVTFTVDDEPVGPGEDKVISVVMKDKAVMLNVLKTAEGTGEVLEGSEFQMEGAFADGSKVQIIKPGKDGSTLEKLLIAGNKYQITETKAPEGYEKLEKPVNFTIDKHGKPEIEGNDNRISLTEWKNGYRISIADRKMPEVIKPVDKPKKDDINAVKTGDGEMPLFYGIMAILSIGAAGVVGVIRRRKRR